MELIHNWCEFLKVMVMESEFGHIYSYGPQIMFTIQSRMVNIFWACRPEFVKDVSLDPDLTTHHSTIGVHFFFYK